jgi:hypothetical protein
MTAQKNCPHLGVEFQPFTNPQLDNPRKTSGMRS